MEGAPRASRRRSSCYEAARVGLGGNDRPGALLMRGRDDCRSVRVTRPTHLPTIEATSLPGPVNVTGQDFSITFLNDPELSSATARAARWLVCLSRDCP